MRLLPLLLYSITFSCFAVNKGEISFEYHRYLESENDDLDSYKAVTLDISQDLNFLSLSGKSAVLAKLNTDDKESSYLFLNELFFYSSTEFFDDVSFGKQIFNWSRLESFSPIDIINSRILDGDIEGFSKKGEIALTALKEYSSFRFEFNYYPFFTDNFYPSKNARISNDTRPEASKIVTSQEITEDKLAHQFAMSAEFSYLDIDFFTFFSRHIDRRNPIVGYGDFQTIAQTNIPIGKLGAHHYWVRQYGGAATYVHGEHIFKGEFLSTSFLNQDFQILTTNGVIRAVDNKALSLGYELSHTYSSGYTSNAFVEYHKLLGLDEDSAQEVSVFQNDIFFGYRLSFNDAMAKELTLGFYYDLERDGEYLFTTKYTQRLSDYWKIKFGYRAFGFDSDDFNGLYLLKNDNEINIELSRYF